MPAFFHDDIGHNKQNLKLIWARGLSFEPYMATDSGSIDIDVSEIPTIWTKDCFEENIQLTGGDIVGAYPTMADQVSCERLCQNNDACNAWSWSYPILEDSDADY